MTKKILATCALASTVIVFIAIFLTTNTTEHTIDNTRSYENLISITISSSRPGCEKTNTCYMPSKLMVYQGDTVTWINDDSAFHTVTSGVYDKYDGLFDSGQLDPAQIFSYKFEEDGLYDYYCRLHPWMDGQVLVR